MTDATADRARRSRRLVVGGGVLALAVLFVAGVAVQVPAMEDGLTRSAERALAARQLDVSVAFSGQDATLSCSAPLDDVAAARDAVASVDGVRQVRLDTSCTGAEPTSSTQGVPVDSISSDGGTAAPPATDGTVPPETSPTTSSTTPPTTSPTTGLVEPEPGVVTITFQNGLLSMKGTVASSDQHALLLTTAASIADPANITDEVVDDPSVPVPDDAVEGLASLMTAMAVPLVAAELTWRPAGTDVRGMFTDDAARDAFQAAAAVVGVTPLLVARPVASAESATALRDELNRIVAATPVEFDKGQTTVSASSAAVLQRIAGVAKSYGGVIVQVQGHTDSEGDPGRNQTLSDERAAAVRAELVRLGVPAADITAVGFGESQLVTDANGSELPDQSRRVVFDVITNSG